MFIWKGARYRICSPLYDLITEEIKKQRSILEAYIQGHPDFKTSFRPLCLHSGAPSIAIQMARASEKTNVGPMAAVAGAIAEAGVKAACEAGAEEAIVENGGDIYLASSKEMFVGLYSGRGKLSDTLAFFIKPGDMPLAICSSSSRMGHSDSFGSCDLATVTAKDGALADAAATYVCNSVKKVEDIESVLEKSGTIPGVHGILIIKDNRIGMIGELPAIVKNPDPGLKNKITHDICWKF
ncbi:MAG: UPF0280 family protein [Spirochaetales bacterium]|nr:UPF0280 family protein [Spirochaetales bacterium]